MDDEDKDYFVFQWKIKNFSYATNQTGEALESPPFPIEILDDTRWYLSVYPRGKEDNEFIDIFVTRCSEDGGDVKIPIIFTIELEAADSTRKEQRVSPESIFERKSSWGFERYIRRKTLLEDMKSTFLPDDTLTIHCKLERVPSEVDYITQYIAESYPETVDIEVPWTINNWSQASEVYEDAKFTGDHEASFRMFICESKYADKNLVLKLEKLESKNKIVYVSCRVAVLDTEDSEVLVGTTHHRFSDLAVDHQELFNREDIKDSFLKDGALRLRCVLSMETGNMLHKMTEKVIESQIDEDEDENLDAYVYEDFVKDYENLFASGNFSDVKLRAGSKVINSHSSILYARSQVLSGLLDEAKVYSEGGIDKRDIYINDLDGDTLEQMIYFLYSDKIKNINPTRALKLLVAAHKYRVEHLKQKCSLYLSQAFTFENVYDILMAAHVCRQGDLKRAAIDYLSEYFSRICLTTEWENFRKTEKDLGAYVCREIRRIKKL